MRLVSYEGVLLCSQRDPLKEAERWCLDIPNFSHIIVLGLGAGYHVETLAAKYPQSHIHVFDHRKTLVDSFNSFSKISNVTVKVLDLDKIELDSFFCSENAYKYAKIFYPSVQSNYGQYHKLQKTILARDPLVFEHRAKQSGIDCLNWDKIKKFDEINIKAIYECKSDATQTDPARIIIILRELVK